MLEILRAWLNGRREYAKGVTLFAILHTDTQLLNLFKSGETPFTRQRLQAELLAICKQMKQSQGIKPPPPINVKKSLPKRIEIARRVITTAESVVNSFVATEDDPEEICANPELYAAAKKEADLAYKACMNQRAELFAKTRMNAYEDPNRPDLVAERGKMAVEVVVAFNKLSILYEQAAHIKTSGRLQATESEPGETEYNALPDILVKQTLDNLRKNYNKIKKREPTPERIALLQKHEENIKKLSDRWHSLKQGT